MTENRKSCAAINRCELEKETDEMNSLSQHLVSKKNTAGAAWIEQQMFLRV